MSHFGRHTCNSRCVPIHFLVHSHCLMLGHECNGRYVPITTSVVKNNHGQDNTAELSATSCLPATSSELDYLEGGEGETFERRLWQTGTSSNLQRPQAIFVIASLHTIFDAPHLQRLQAFSAYANYVSYSDAPHL